MHERTETIECPNCGGKFKLTEFNPDGLGWEKATYSCPHGDCNYSKTRKSAGYFETQTATD
ncbi:hypothetical protein [Pseudoalteromonas prydzensis]|uniref:hypothetical protein n=1 Tax=Pseudoalteromonas prydzensis TaxID=182141 RepID=UPI003FD2E820